MRLPVLLLLLILAASCSKSTAPKPATNYTYDLIFDGKKASLTEIWVLETGTDSLYRFFAANVPAYTPVPYGDGTKISFGYDIGNPDETDVWRVERDGNHFHQITFDSGIDDQPTWAPDGHHIAWRSFRTQRLGDIWVMDEHGLSPVQLTFDPLPAVYDESHPAWSPDGAKIAYVSNAGGDVDIWIMNADGSNQVRLTNTPDFDTEPAWSPDGRRIVFRRSTAGVGSDLMIISPSGGTPTPLTLPGEQRTPVWSPDGTRIFFTGQDSIPARTDIYSMKSDGTDVRIAVPPDSFPNGCQNPAFLRRL
jgi:Tol biopolymer transport system component